MSQEHNIVSVSGGKDSTALLLLAIERETPNLQAVFADTGHEHQLTYDYVGYLEQATSVPIRRVKADFAAQIAKKRTYVTEKWPGKLMANHAGYWEWCGAPEETPEKDPSDLFAPQDECVAAQVGDWFWRPAKIGLTAEQAQGIVARALRVLEPTGNPFLDLCIWKGRFPSTKARFCSEELKKNPMINQVQKPLLDAGHDVISWQGVRADESPSRALLNEMDCITQRNGTELWNYRPILKWTVEEVFAMHRKHGIKPNPLYEQGMGRVGCMPCIHCRKDELLEISKRFPEEIERVAEWERIVAQASKLGLSSFFATADGRGNNITEAVEWSKTSRGGQQYDLIRTDRESMPLCSSIYGLCE